MRLETSGYFCGLARHREAKRSHDINDECSQDIFQACPQSSHSLIHFPLSEHQAVSSSLQPSVDLAVKTVKNVFNVSRLFWFLNSFF